MLPQLIAHADWGTNRRKRWMSCATQQTNGRYFLTVPEPVGDAPALLDTLRNRARFGGILVGFDFPIGLPQSYAERAGVTNFIDLLPQLGLGEWIDFYHAASSPREINLRRPFYPLRPGGTRQQHLLDGLGVSHIDELRRRCDRGHAGRRAAAPIFWTMGAQQVGKAAISGWRDVIGPALRERSDVKLWPFDGSLDVLLGKSDCVIIESYPAEYYRHLDVSFPPRSGGKRSQSARAANSASLLSWLNANQVTFDPELPAQIEYGFGSAADGEDRFDALIGLLGMLNVLFGRREAGEPADGYLRQVEGWIFGMRE